MIRLALFDIDGTLIRTGGAGVKAFERTFALEFGLAEATKGIEFAGRTDPSLVRQCFRLHRIEESPANFRRFFDTYIFLLYEILELSNGAACSGVVDFLRDLTCVAQPPLIGLLTGNIRLGAELKLRRYGLWEHFLFGGFGDDDENRNRLAVLARRRGEQILGYPVRGEEILVVGDTPLDVECGKAIDAKVLAVGTGGYSCDELRVCKPTWAVANLAELKAHEVCAHGHRQLAVA